jgi:hypothetical protein
MPPAAAPGLFGPHADAEGLVLALLHRQDRYLARRTCSTRRRELGAGTRTLVLSEDGEEALVLPTVNLASSFPALRTLVLLCEGDAREGWLERFAAFATRSRGALQQLRHLDLGEEDDAAAPPSDAAPIVTSGALAALALLPALQSLHATVEKRLDPSSWSALASLTQLTSLRLFLLSDSYDQHLQQIVEAAPQLQELWVYGSDSLPMACLTRLRSLGSLQLGVAGQDAQALRSLTALQGLTHLGLALDSGELSAALLAAVAQLTGLASLSLFGHELGDDVTVMSLVALQQLTSLVLEYCAVLDHDDALALASLAQLRRLQATFDSPAAAAAAGLARLEECRVEVDGRHGGEPVSLARAGGAVLPGGV